MAIEKKEEKWQPLHWPRRMREFMDEHGKLVTVNITVFDAAIHTRESGHVADEQDIRKTHGRSGNRQRVSL